jgi:hypothetical protein
MTRYPRKREGIALPMAIGAIVIIGVLIAGAMFAAVQDQRVGANTLQQARASAASELGLNRTTAEWNVAYNSSLKQGDTLQRSYSAPGGASATVTATRLQGPFFWMVSEGKAGGNQFSQSARRRFGMLLRLDTPDVPFMGALTGRGTITVGGSATVNGNDANPSAWAACPSPGVGVAGIAMSDTTAGLKMPGCSVSKSCVNGTPKFIQTLLAADTATYFVYGNSTYQALAASATLPIAAGSTLTGIFPVSTGGVCTKTTLNWGDVNRALPAGPCEPYFPTIHALGDLHISGGSGQGILLVDGDLSLSGGFAFTGIVIVRGSLTTTGTGGKVTGGVMAANIDLDGNTVLGNSSIQYSSCAINTVMQGSAKLIPAKGRPWVDLY